MNKILNEIKKYTHFAVNKNNKIIFGWNYSDVDSDELKNFKKDYFMNDIMNMEYNLLDVKIYNKNYLIKHNINPLDLNNWE